VAESGIDENRSEAGRMETSEQTKQEWRAHATELFERTYMLVLVSPPVPPATFCRAALSSRSYL
jgi:hypothetical protein